jgi:DNA-binding CsgD family transcriptional regulator
MMTIGDYIYIPTILIGMISIGVNVTVFLIYKKPLHKYLSLILSCMELIVVSVFIVVYHSSFHSTAVFLLCRGIMQIGLFCLFAVMPLFYGYILNIELRKYRMPLTALYVVYFILGVLIVLLYMIDIKNPALMTDLETANLTILNLMSFGCALAVLLGLQRIRNKFLRYNLLVINLFAVICAPVNMLEFTLNQTNYSVAVFIFLFNVFFILPTLFNLGKTGTDQQNALPTGFASRYGITVREREIIVLLRNGLSYRSIGEKLFISAKTVETHVYSIYRKTGVKNRLQLFQLTGGV